MAQLVRAACPHDCPDTCAMHVTVKDGRATHVTGDPDHPITVGFLCGKVSNYLDRVYSEDRILHPLVRTGPKGAGEFRQASWDEALDVTAERLQGLGESILPYSYMGTQGLVQGNVMSARVMNALGASELERTICATAGIVGVSATQGISPEVDPEEWPHARYVIVWGWNPMSTAPHLWRKLLDARKAGARLVVVDPFRSRTARVADEHLSPVPGTDAALALGMMRAIADAGLQDEEWCREHAEGYDELHRGARRVAARSRRGHLRRAGRGHRARRPRVRHDAARAGAAGGRRAAAPGRARGVPDGGEPACARRRVAPPRRRLLVHPDRHRRRHQLGTARAGRPQARPDPHHQHVPDRRRADGSRPRASGEGVRVLELQPRRNRPGPDEGARRARARGPVHGRARAVHDRYGPPRRRGAAGDHPARAPGRPVLVGPPLRDLERAGDRAAGGGEAEH